MVMSHSTSQEEENIEHILLSLEQSKDPASITASYERLLSLLKKKDSSDTLRSLSDNIGRFMDVFDRDMVSQEHIHMHRARTCLGYFAYHDVLAGCFDS